MYRTWKIKPIWQLSFLTSILLTGTIMAGAEVRNSNLEIGKSQDSPEISKSKSHRQKSCRKEDIGNSDYAHVIKTEVAPDDAKKDLIPKVITTTKPTKTCIQRLKDPANAAAGTQEICGEDYGLERVLDPIIKSLPPLQVGLNFVVQTTKDPMPEFEKIYDVTVSHPCEIHVSNLPTNRYFGDIFKGLEGTNIRNISIETADMIIIDGPIKLPGANLNLIAGQIVVTDGGKIDLTPKADSAIPAVGESGHGGMPGSDVRIESFSVVDERTNIEPFIIARGGAGQDAGPSQEGIKGIDLPTYEPYFITAIKRRGMRIPDQYKKLENHVVGWDRIHEERSRCDMFRSNCNKNWSVEARGILGGNEINKWKGADAIPGGFPGVGGSGGKVTVVPWNETAVLPDNSVDVSPGENGKPASNANGNESGLPRDIVIFRTAANGKQWIEEWYKSVLLKDAISPTSPIQIPIQGEITVYSR